MLKTIPTQHCQVIKTFSTREAAGEALYQLVVSGFPIAQLFLLGNGIPKNPHSIELGSEASGKVTGTATGLKRGMFFGNLVGGGVGLFLGAGLIALPGVGQLALSEMIAFVLLSGGVCTAAGGLMGALIGLLLTGKQAKAYEKETARGSVLLLVEGKAKDIALAQHLLKKSAI
jgi:hypothetical protein